MVFIINILFSHTLVSNNINIMKTTFSNLILIFIKLLNSMDTQKYGNKEKLSL